MEVVTMRKLFFFLLILASILGSPVLAAGTDFTVDFAANSTSGSSPHVVQFYNLVTGNQVNCSWGIDGTIIDSCPGPLHTFTIPGDYDINLTVTND